MTAKTRDTVKKTAILENRFRTYSPHTTFSENRNAQEQSFLNSEGREVAKKLGLTWTMGVMCFDSLAAKGQDTSDIGISGDLQLIEGNAELLEGDVARQLTQTQEVETSSGNVDLLLMLIRTPTPPQPAANTHPASAFHPCSMPFKIPIRSTLIRQIFWKNRTFQ